MPRHFPIGLCLTREWWAGHVYQLETHFKYYVYVFVLIRAGNLLASYESLPFFVYGRTCICIHTSYNAGLPPENPDITVKIVAVSPFPPLSKKAVIYLVKV